MRQLPEQCESCKKQIATLETCVLPDGTEKRGAEVTSKESAKGGIRCIECAGRSGGASWAATGRSVLPASAGWTPIICLQAYLSGTTRCCDNLLDLMGRGEALAFPEVPDYT